MIFGSYQYLWGLLLVLLIVLISFSVMRWRVSTMEKFADSRLLQNIFPFVSNKRIYLKVILSSSALLLVLLALMDPMYGLEEKKVKREGIDLVFALDLSNSMNAEDVPPSRLEKAKKIIEETLNNLGGDRVGLIAFAGNAYTISPLTNDYTAISNYLVSADTDMVSEQGTNFESMTTEAVQVFQGTANTSKLLIVLSDGEDNESGIDQAVELAKENNIHVLTIGIGTQKGDRIPITNDYGVQDYKHDQYGEIVISKLQEENLKTFSQQTAGAYIQANDLNATVKSIQNFQSKLDKNEIATSTTSDRKHIFQWILGLVIILLFVETLTTEYKFIKTKKL